MHLILAIRGIKHEVELWEKFMQTQWFEWKRYPLLKDEKGEFIKNDDGSYKHGPEEISNVQGALRPLQFYEYVFPKECLKEVLAMMNEHKQYNKPRPEMKPLYYLIRKIYRGRKIPSMPEIQNKEPHEITNKFVPKHGVAIYCICIKDDTYGDMPHYGYCQEGL